MQPLLPRPVLAFIAALTLFFFILLFIIFFVIFLYNFYHIFFHLLPPAPLLSLQYIISFPFR